MKGHIYNCSDFKQADIFICTTKEIAEYVGWTYKYGRDARLAVKKLYSPTFTEPINPAADASKTKIRMWEKLIKEYVKRQTYLEENLKTIYSLVWGQRMDIIQQPLEALDTFKTMSIDSDSMGLL